MEFFRLLINLVMGWNWFFNLQIKKASCGDETSCIAQTGGIHMILFADLLLPWDDTQIPRTSSVKIRALG